MKISVTSGDVPLLKVCYILCYYSPHYIRTQTLVDALHNLPSVHLIEARNRHSGISRYLETLWRLFLIRLRDQPDVYILGFRGHEIFVPTKLIAGTKYPLVFDEFVSPYDSFVFERKKLPRSSLLARMLYALERRILCSATLLLTDTQAQAEHYAELLQIPRDKFHTVTISADQSLFTPDGEQYDYGTSEFIVFTYATFLPLHGVDMILEAAARLRDWPVRFVIAGGKGVPLRNFEDKIRVQGLTNVEHIAWIDFGQLPAYIRGAGLCLGGPFGDTPQARRIITGKAVQFLACGKPTVIGRSAASECLEDRKNCLIVPQRDADALAEAITWALNNQDALSDIGRGGRMAYEHHFSERQVREQLRTVLNKAAHYVGKQV